MTIHKLSTLFDRGDILIQQAINIEPSETLETLSAKTQLLAHDLMGAVLEKFDNLWTSAVPQEDGSYWLRPTNEEQTISWHDSIDLISRKVRAFGKFDTNAVIEGVKYFVHDVGVWKCEHSFVPGAVVHRMNREIVVAASDGFVCVRFFEQVTE
ncbi:MAG: hypothetical protein H6863_05435 [Rhodospirillales bacterium]|nr:hypothetical protein [Rhodospirillales bacterium]